ncbi:MAG: M13 family metallopeptidase [Rhizobacter sp.]|nr:M13 family metallopeptidase [Rhizobacter sp.]
MATTSTTRAAMLRWAAAAALLLCAGLAGAGELRSGIDRTTFDPAVRPQDDLFLAANGGWLKATPIPPDKSAYGIFQELSDRADERVRAICEGLAQGEAAPGSIEQKIGSYYRSYVDVAAIDAAGLAPLKPWLDEVDALATPAELVAQWGRWQGIVNTPMLAYVGADPKEPGINRVSAGQGGLGLPDRDFYLLGGDSFVETRAAYRTYLETLLRLSGDADAKAHAQQVFALELKLARAQWSRVDSQDAIKTYNPMTLPVLAKRAPGVDWVGYFRAAAIPSIDRLSVNQPSYARTLAKLVQTTPMSTWKLYQRTRLLDANAQVLPQAFRDAEFTLRGKAQRGQEQDKPRWQRATAAIDGALGEAVGQVYVARHFPPEAKARMQELVANLLAAYGQSIDALKWMTPATKRHAHEKLSKYLVKIGYPDKWRDYSKLEVRDGDALGNQARAGRFEHERVAAQVGQPVDRSEWAMTPQTVNAYYNPGFNEIVFPAAILDAPFFDLGADDAANYGATGATIGHEISHGFDDQGSRYDGDGKLSNWWTRADRRAFDALGRQLVKQFNAYEPVPGHRINGKLTLGENIADLSGLEIAYKAWKLSLKGQEPPVIDGMTGDQRFFYAWAISWREKMREARTLELITSDEHAPAEFRANGAVTNLDAFQAAFRTQPGDRLYKPREQRIRIW